MLDAKLLKNVKISCIVPAYEEESRIGTVLESVITYKHFYEIIVVDDGSSDGTADVVKKYVARCRNLKLLQSTKNMGKTMAVLKGVQRVKGNIIVLLDADLQNLYHEYIDKMLYFVLSGRFDMSILDRLTDKISPVGALGLSRLFGGERAFWKKDFLDMHIQPNEGYNLETIMNMWYIKNNKRVVTVWAPELKSAWQFGKWGIIKGMSRYIKMFWGMYKSTGLKNFFVQMSNVADENILEVYEWYNKRKNRKYIVPFVTAFFLGSSAFIASYMLNQFIKQKINAKKKKP